jgi:serine/threonine protein kinase
MVGLLKVVDGLDAGRCFDLAEGQTLVIGRGRDTATRLTDLRVSRVHCVLEVSGGRFHLTDSGSASGTLVNGVAITTRDLSPGDTIRVGETTLVLTPADVHEQATITSGGAPHPVAHAHAHTHTPAAVKDLSGQILASYEILSPIARGRTGVVYKARDRRDGKLVALKVLGPEYSRRQEEFRRFARAVQTVVKLRHENLVAVYAGAGKRNVLCWIAMELVDGESLTEVIRRIGPANMLDWRYSLKVAAQVARALDAAHKSKIIHRNITPANILIRRRDNLAKLNDLILAKATEGMLDRQITAPGELVGDVRYMPPERTGESAEVDPRCDLYSLGATVYSLLTGRPPFEGHSLPETIAQIRTAAPVPPRKYQLAIPELFQDVVLSMLSKRPEDRPSSAAALLQTLERTARYQGLAL